MAQTSNTTSPRFEGLPCAEVRRSCNFIMQHQTSVTISDAKIDDFIREMEQKVQAEGAFVFDKWQDFHLADIAKYSVE